MEYYVGKATDCHGDLAVSSMKESNLLDVLCYLADLSSFDSGRDAMHELSLCWSPHKKVKRTMKEALLRSRYDFRKRDPTSLA